MTGRLKFSLKVIRVMNRIIFYLTLLFLMISIFSLTIGQKLSVEFADWKVMHEYYNIIFGGIPIAILLTLFGTIKTKHSIIMKICILALTIFTVIISYVILVSIMFSIGFGAWINESILYHKRDNPRITINEQIFDVGALGYGGKRIVKLKPFMKYWNTISRIDTLLLNKDEWIFINKKDDIEFP